MDTTQKTRISLTHRIAATGFLLAALLTANQLQAQDGQRALDRAKGEEMLHRAHIDLAEANRMSEAAVAAVEKAQDDQEMARHKREEALKLQREAFFLIHDSRRLEAAELRARADEQEVQVKTEFAELRRVQRLLAHQQQVATDATGASANVRAAAANEPNPTEKAEMNKMADTLSEQATQADAEAASLNQRVHPLEVEISRLKYNIKQRRDLAQKLAPMEM